MMDDLSAARTRRSKSSVNATELGGYWRPIVDVAATAAVQLLPLLLVMILYI